MKKEVHKNVVEVTKRAGVAIGGVAGCVGLYLVVSASAILLGCGAILTGVVVGIMGTLPKVGIAFSAFVGALAGGGRRSISEGRDEDAVSCWRTAS